MAKKPQFGGTPQEVALFNALQELSMKEASGQDITKELQEKITNAMEVGTVKSKTTPNLIPVDSSGNPLSLEQVYEILIDNGHDIELLVQKLAYIADPNGYQWREISKVQTGAAGGLPENVAEAGLYGVLKLKVNNARILEINTKSADINYLESEAKKLILEQISILNLPPVNYAPKGVMYGVDFRVTNIPEGMTNYKVFAAVTLNIDKMQLNVTDSSLISVNSIEIKGWATPPSNAKPLNIEHTLADAFLSATQYLSNAYKFRDKVKAYQSKIIDTTDKALISSVITNINKAIDAMELNLKAFKLLTLQIGEDLPADGQELLAFYRGLVEQGIDLGFHVVYREKTTNKLNYRSVKISAELEVLLKNNKGYFFGGRAALNQVKGNIERFFKNSLASAWFWRRSPSAYTSLLLVALSDILDGKNNASKKFLKKNLVKNLKKFIPLAKKSKAPKVSKKRFLSGNSRPKRQKGLDYKSSSRSTQQTTQNIVPLINAELKRYVIEEMSYPSLENRSGRFAGSVRVLSAQENAAVQYTYQKSPYQVFSPARGKRPWATEERDPAKIIDRAIKRIGQDRFQKVFRTEEV